MHPRGPSWKSPAALVGAVTYAVQGEAHWLAALALEVGRVPGASIGSCLLRAISLRVLPWVLLKSIAVVLVSLLANTPTCDGDVQFDVLEVAVPLGVGVLSGVLTGLVGIGSGVVIVLGLELALGADDLLAKGPSLLTMVPTAVSGTVADLWRDERPREGRVEHVAD